MKLFVANTYADLIQDATEAGKALLTAVDAAAQLSAIGAIPTAGGTFTGKVLFAASTTSSAGVCFASGVAPTSPADGDFWRVNGSLYVQYSGNTFTLARREVDNTWSNHQTFQQPICGPVSSQILWVMNPDSPTTPQSLAVSNTWATSTNFERFRVRANTTQYEIGSDKGSAGGSNRTVAFGHYDTSGTFTTSASFDTSGNWTFVGKLATAASVSGGAGLCITPGSGPSSPALGEIWNISGQTTAYWRLGAGTSYQFAFLNRTNSWANAQTFTAAVTFSSTYTGRRLLRTAAATTASALTPDVSTYDRYTYSALASTLTFSNPTGTPNDGDLLHFLIKDDGTTRTLTWSGSQYQAYSIALPTATTAAKYLRLTFEWNNLSSKWVLFAKIEEA